MKVLIVLLTDNRYVHLISQLWQRIIDMANFELSKNYQIDKLIITESNDTEVIKYANNNNLSIEYTFVDLKDAFSHNIDLQYITESGFTFKRYYKVIQLRNFYLDIALKRQYDWLLQIDGDVLPPKDGLQQLLATNKRYVGAGVVSKNGGLYVVPDKMKDNKVYKCQILGNCFHLEHRDCFSTPYLIKKNKRPPTADTYLRLRELEKRDIFPYCCPWVKCKHLK